MTPLQSEVYRAVCKWWDEYHFGPSLEDLRFVLMLGSKQAVKKVVDVLVERGHLKRERYRRRGIRPNKRMTIID